MNYENWISFKYLTAKRERFFSVMNLVSIAGVAIGVMALIVVIAVMTGFDNDLRDKIIGTTSHIVVEKETGIKDYNALQDKIAQIPDVIGTTVYVRGNVFLEEGRQALGLALRGINPQTEGGVTQVEHYLKQGKLPDLVGNTVVVGSELANYFGYNIGDEITVITPAAGLSGERWREKLKIVGIFTSGMYDYDMNLILVNYKKAQEIFQLQGDTVSGIAVKLKNIYNAKKVKDTLYGVVGFEYIVRTWIESNSNFFAALRLEKFAMFIILTLIVLVASFNIISTLIVTVTSKTKDIGILKSIGVPKSSIRRIFTVEGVSLGLIGTFWGVVGGVGLSLILKKYQFIKLPREIYYVDRMPIIVQLSDLLMIIGSAMIISYLATLYPASKAASLEPVEALRYE